MNSLAKKERKRIATLLFKGISECKQKKKNRVQSEIYLFFHSIFLISWPETPTRVSTTRLKTIVSNFKLNFIFFSSLTLSFYVSVSASVSVCVRFLHRTVLIFTFATCALALKFNVNSNLLMRKLFAWCANNNEQKN